MSSSDDEGKLFTILRSARKFYPWLPKFSSNPLSISGAQKVSKIRIESTDANLIDEVLVLSNLLFLFFIT